MRVKDYYLEQVMQALIDLLTPEQQARLVTQLKQNSISPVVKGIDPIWDTSNTDTTMGGSI